MLYLVLETEVGKDRYHCVPYLLFMNKCHYLLHSCSNPKPRNHAVFLPVPHPPHESITWSCWLHLLLIIKIHPLLTISLSPFHHQGQGHKREVIVIVPRFFCASLCQALEWFSPRMVLGMAVWLTLANGMVASMMKNGEWEVAYVWELFSLFLECQEYHHMKKPAWLKICGLVFFITSST